MGVTNRQAGFYMSSKIPIVLKDHKVSKIENYFKSNFYDFEEADYIYVVNKERKFMGFFPSNKLSKFSKNRTALEICRRLEKISVLDEDRREHAIHLSLRHNVSNVPVVDKENRLLGAILSKQVLHLLHNMHVEEKLQLSGLHRSYAELDSILNISVFKSIKHRAVWLLIGLFGGLLAAEIIEYFTNTLQAYIILAAFIPLVVYLASAVGTQLEAFAIRDFALFRNLNFPKYFFKQIQAVFIIAILLGGASGLISYLMYNNFKISFVLCVSIIITTLSSIITGLLIPFIFRKFKKDPANGSGPIGTIIQDLLSVIIYLVTAQTLL